jgi:hypothetical protein
MELYFEENRHIVSQFLACQKRHLELWKEGGIEFHVQIYLKITNFASDTTIYFIFFNVCIPNKNLFSINIENHNIDTGQRNKLYPPQIKLIIYQTGAYNLGIKIFNNLSLEIKNVAGKQIKFKIALKTWVYTYSVYTVEEYLRQS